jgi:hypothetical protein
MAGDVLQVLFRYCATQPTIMSPVALSSGSAVVGVFDGKPGLEVSQALVSVAPLFFSGVLLALEGSVFLWRAREITRKFPKGYWVLS